MAAALNLPVVMAMPPRHQPSITTTGTSILASRRRWRLGVFLGVAGFVVTGGCLELMVENELEKQVGRDLDSVLDSRVEAVKSWGADVLKTVGGLAKDPEVREPALRLAKFYYDKSPDAAALRAQPSQEQLWRVLKSRFELLGYPGGGLVAHDDVVLCARNREVIGQALGSFLHAVIERVRKGTPALSKPFLSPLPFPDRKGVLRAEQPTMFATVPVRDADDKVLAVLAVRLRPEDDFTQILRRGQMRQTGEAYAFDRTGLLLSESRFNDDLRAVGLLLDSPDSNSILRVEIRNPGVNMVTGGRPQELRKDQELTLMARSATAGNPGQNLSGYRDYRGVFVVGSWTWLENLDLGICAEIDFAEAYRPLRPLRITFFVMLGLLVLALIGVLLYSRLALVLRSRVHKTLRQVQKLGQYTLGKKLGEGGMGEVYKARHAMLRRPTAVKLLHPDRNRAVDTMRFEREVQLTSMLTHPNTIAVYDFGRAEDDVFYYVMEYLNGMPLHHVVGASGALPAARVIHILEQVCGSLSEAHELGLIHRDIKPANIMLCARGGMHDFIKVLDFGLVRDLEKRIGATLTEANTVAGTPQYLSPEAIKADAPLDARADLYSLGCVAYFLLTGNEVIQRDTTMRWVSDILHKTPPATSVVRPSVPKDLDDVVMSLLAKDRDQRPASAAVLAERLRACQDHGAWSEAEASRWWESHGPKDQEDASDITQRSTLVETHSLVVELNDRDGGSAEAG